MQLHSADTPVEASEPLLPCYLDPLRDCSETVDGITTNLVVLAAALVGVGVGVLTLWMALPL